MKLGVKLTIVVALLAVVAGAIVLKVQQKNAARETASAATQTTPGVTTQIRLPRLVDLGAKSCIPCKQMAPILEELRAEYAGRMQVDFIDVWQNKQAGQEYGIKLIPTQIFFDTTGQEVARHEGFMSKADILAQWATLGITLTHAAPTVQREKPLVAQSQPAETTCFMCGKEFESYQHVQVNTATDVRHLCSVHCYFIYLTSLPKPEGIEAVTQVTDSVTGELIPATTASYKFSFDDNARPVYAPMSQVCCGGSILTWEQMKAKELAVRCSFCDRACYPEDSTGVNVSGAQMYACCPVCGLGTAARLQKDVTLTVQDAQTGERLQITTLNGSVATLTPATIVAWHGQKPNAEGKMVSSGCFNQFFFATPEHLQQWLGQHPAATGKQATISELLADKMKLSPQQISKACKIGDCTK